MSGAAMKWARAQNIESGPHARALDVLAQLANEKRGNSLFHSQRVIADRLHYSIRTTRNLLADLEVLGIIQRAKRSRGRGRGRTSDLIRLAMDRPFNLTREEIRTRLQAARTASCNAQPAETYKRQFSHLQAAVSAGDRITSDQLEEVFTQEEQPQGFQSALGGKTTKPNLQVLNGGRAA